MSFPTGKKGPKNPPPPPPHFFFLGGGQFSDWRIWTWNSIQHILSRLISFHTFIPKSTFESTINNKGRNLYNLIFAFQCNHSITLTQVMKNMWTDYSKYYKEKLFFHISFITVLQTKWRQQTLKDDILSLHINGTMKCTCISHLMNTTDTELKSKLFYITWIQAYKTAQK